MKTFGLVIPSGKGATFGNNVRMFLDGHQSLSRIILPLTARFCVGLEIRSDICALQLLAT